MTKMSMLLAIVSIFVISSLSAFACSCVELGTPLEQLEWANAVFTGKVVDIDIPRGIVISSADPVKVTFEVSKIWKGTDDKTLVVTTAREGASCGYSFERGESYLVYAYLDQPGNVLQATSCSRTALLSDAEEDLAKLGKSFAPTTTISSEGNTSNIFVFALILLLISFVIFFYRKKNKKHNRY